MAVVITPLGFKKPDLHERVKDGDNIIADNAQKAQDLLGNALPRLEALEAVAFAAGAVLLIEDPADPGFFILAEEA